MWRLFLLLLIAGAMSFTVRAQDTNLLKTDIEMFESQTDRVIVVGIGSVGTISTPAGTMNVHAVEATDAGTGHKQYGATFQLETTEGRIRFAVDYNELQPFLNGIDYLVRVTSDVTALPSFEAQFTTKSCLSVIAFSSRKQGTIQFYIQFGELPRIQLTSDQVSQFRDLVNNAKKTLDDLMAGK